MLANPSKSSEKKVRVSVVRSVWRKLRSHVAVLLCNSDYLPDGLADELRKLADIWDRYDEEVQKL